MRWQHEEDVEDCNNCKQNFSVTRRKVNTFTFGVIEKYINKHFLNRGFCEETCTFVIDLNLLIGIMKLVVYGDKPFIDITFLDI